MNKYKKVIDNKMRWQGDIDTERHIIRINKAKSKKKSSIIDTIIHEEMHAKHPRMYESTIREETIKALNKMTPKQKSLKYNQYR